MGTDGLLLHDSRLHMVFLPLMAPGHMIPMIDIAKLFSRRGVRCTVVTTAGNAAVVSSAIKNTSGVDLHLIPLPASIDFRGRENLSELPSRADQVAFLRSLEDLRPSFEAVLQDLRPKAVVADRSFDWATELCAQFHIPRLVFHGTCAFANCALASVFQRRFHEEPLDGDESRGSVVVLEGLPHRIEMLKTQLPNPDAVPPEQAALIEKAKVSEAGSYGVLVNSFFELEPNYARHYREVLGRKTWHVGPVSLCNHDTGDLAVRGAAEWATPTARRCQEWLDSKPPGFVLYICFGSVAPSSAAQIKEISLALTSIHHPFIWVVRGDSADDGLEAIKSKEAQGECLIVRGWAPQVLILNHESVGGFMTHCGWNSSLESISAGVPMVTWPYFADQFFNEKLLVDVLSVGIAVGSKHYWVGDELPIIAAADIEVAIKRLMDNGVDAEARRQRAKELSIAAHRSVMEGGSSYEDIGRLIKELESQEGHASGG